MKKELVTLSITKLESGTGSTYVNVEACNQGPWTAVELTLTRHKSSELVKDLKLHDLIVVEIKIPENDKDLSNVASN